MKRILSDSISYNKKLTYKCENNDIRIKNIKTYKTSKNGFLTLKLIFKSIRNLLFLYKFYFLYYK